jgi:hypothetical protein
MTILDYYEVVEFIESPLTRELGIAHETGVIVGIAEEEGSVWYAVLFNDETYSASQNDVHPTGRRLRREDSARRRSPGARTRAIMPDFTGPCHY